MHKILIVEDDPIVLFIYKGKLQNSGFSVTTAMEGDKVIEILNNQSFDIMLLDIMLPKKTGIEILKYVQSKPSLSHLPVIVFTNAYFPEMIRQATTAGAKECLSKAEHKPESVISVLQKYLKINKLESTPVKTIDLPDQGKVTPELDQNKDFFVENIGRDFIKTVPEVLSAIRTNLLDLEKISGSDFQKQRFEELFLQIRALASQASSVGFSQLAQFSTALESLFLCLIDNPAKATPSVMEIFTQTVDFLGVLQSKVVVLHGFDISNSSVLVVDDDPISLQIITEYLRILQIKPVLVDNPVYAKTKLKEFSFDIILLDIGLPSIDGINFCKELRSRSGLNQNTPVIFITSADNQENRQQTRLSGGTDFVGKPFLSSTFNTKILLNLFRSLLVNHKN